MQQIAGFDRSTVPAAKRKRRRALHFWLYNIGIFIGALVILDMVAR